MTHLIFFDSEGGKFCNDKGNALRTPSHLTLSDLETSKGINFSEVTAEHYLS